MNKKSFIAVLLIVLIGGAVLVVKNSNRVMREDVAVEEEAMVGGTMKDKTMTRDDQVMMEEVSGYVEYDEQSFAADKKKKRVLFFYAAWCPTCRPADKEISDRVKEIPEGVVVYRVNYDTEEELKERYGITYQHTFVLVDENGEEVEKWNGGSIDEIIEKVK